MYRRPRELFGLLARFASTHDLQYGQKPTNLINDESHQHLISITGYLAEAKYHRRMGSFLEADSIYLSQCPLVRVEDAV